MKTVSHPATQPCPLKGSVLLYWLLVAASLGAGVVRPSPQLLGAEQSPAEAERDAERARSMRWMKERAEQITVHRQQQGKKVAASVVAKPLIRYNDPPRRFDDATLWLWAVHGRPVAVCKIENHRPSDDRRVWITCLASLSDSVISVEWTNGRRWSATKPGVEFKQIRDAPEASSEERIRLRQMKAVARRFSAGMTRYKDRQKMRLLPNPIYRYGAAETGLVEGAVFAFTANGTNPDGLLVIELHRTRGPRLTWHYGIVRVTADTLEVQLDGEPVWKQGRPDRGREETMIDFYEPNTGSSRQAESD